MLTMAHTCKNKQQQRYLDWDLCVYSPDIAPSDCQAEQIGEPGCVKEVCISLLC